MDGTTAFLVLAALLVLVGLAGTVLPAIPGVPMLFGGLALAAWAEGFAHVSMPWLVALGVLAVLAYAVDFLAGMVGARHFGASQRAMVGAAIGAVVGLFFGLPGILAGPFLGAVIGELTAQRSLGDAGRAGLGAAIGLAMGAAAKLSLAITMVAIFLFLRFF